MKTASVTELKARLSHFVRMARRGTEVEILERGVPVARLVGLPRASAGRDRERIERLSRAGVLRRGRGDVRWLLSEPPIAQRGVELARAVDEDRGDRV
ncbi:MAG: type II toxin-antitoxin system prevent-host-death family antitoxin [Polyangiaceae bacterium]|nr:type II toxin-antitoxin system prevent-host-death family antitoxin [Polyangiaceae bacterium]